MCRPLLHGYLSQCAKRVAKRRFGASNPVPSEEGERAWVVAAWQISMLGLLNIWLVAPLGSIGIFLLSNLFLVVWIVTSDRFIALADTPNQDGGYAPLHFFGKQRSRRLLFWAFAVYPSTVVVLAGVMLFIKMKPYPNLFHPPQLCLLLAAFFSVVVAGLIFHRYHKVPSSGRRIVICSLAVVLIMGTAGIAEFYSASNLNVYPLSFLVVLSISLGSNCLLPAYV